MTQIIVTLENGANTPLLQRMIENMKGVVKTSISITQPKVAEKDDWVDKVTALSESINLSMIDVDDERTQYILDK